MNSKELQAKYTEEYEEQIATHLDLKLDMLIKEKAIKENADFTPLDPAFEYERSEEWIGYLKDVAIHNIFQNELAITKQKHDLTLKSLERRELAEMKVNLEGN